MRKTSKKTLDDFKTHLMLFLVKDQYFGWLVF